MQIYSGSVAFQLCTPRSATTWRLPMTSFTAASDAFAANQPPAYDWCTEPVRGKEETLLLRILSTLTVLKSSRLLVPVAENSTVRTAACSNEVRMVNSPWFAKWLCCCDTLLNPRSLQLLSIFSSWCQPLMFIFFPAFASCRLDPCGQFSHLLICAFCCLSVSSGI